MKQFRFRIMIVDNLCGNKNKWETNICKIKKTEKKTNQINNKIKYQHELKIMYL